MRVFGILMAMILLCGGVGAQEPTEVRFQAEDGTVVFADLYRQQAGAPIVLLFHQAGANARAEYANIIPVLLNRGHNVLAVDQRSGGDRLGGVNRTAEATGGGEFHYCDAYPDVEAALSYARAHLGPGPVFAWGSSYSAALVINLAAGHGPDLAGVLAFSPAAGEPMKSCDPTTVMETVDIPILALRPDREMEIESVRSQLERFRELGHETYISEGGVHGSSMLNPDRAEGVEETWTAVLSFIDRTAAAAAVDAYHAALARGDSAAARALLAEDAFVLESGYAETLDEYLGHHLGADMAFAAAVPSSRNLLQAEVVGDAAWVASTSSMSGEYNGRSVEAEGVELMVLVRVRGAWKISGIHWSSRSRQ